MYIAFFNRPADAGGLNHWASYMEANNGDVTKLMEAFAPSGEYKSIYDGKNTTQLIEAVYQNLFGRSAEPAGLDYWGSRIDSGQISVAGASYSILSGAQNADRTMVLNKTSVANAFTLSMNDSAKVAAYSNMDSTAHARAFLNKVTDDPASVTAAKAVIMDTIKVVGISGSVSGDVITLNHTGRDANIVTFAPTQTLKTATINGFSGNDKIDLSDFAFTGTMAGAVKKTAFQTGADASYFGGKGAVLAESGGTTHVYVDANKDGGYTPGADFDITITGVSAAAVNLIF